MSDAKILLKSAGWGALLALAGCGALALALCFIQPSEDRAKMRCPPGATHYSFVTDGAGRSGVEFDLGTRRYVMWSDGSTHHVLEVTR